MNSKPYENLTPDAVLDALESVGLRGDGRLLALNSYENRVYQVSLEDDSYVVAKFYRPHRWSEAQLLEEHTFAAELVEREIPVVAPFALDGKTLNTFNDIRFAVFPRRGGRPPELENESVLEWIGRVLGRIHASVARSDRFGPSGRRTGRAGPPVHDHAAGRCRNGPARRVCEAIGSLHACA